MSNFRLSTCENLVAFDGADGTGKTKIVSRVQELLNGSGARTTVISPTKLSGTSKLEMLSKIASRHPRLSSFAYSLGVRYSYLELILPAIKVGELVLLDRSEFDLVRYAIFRGLGRELKQRLNYICSGAATVGMWPMTRIVVVASPTSILSNLSARKSNSIHDPCNFGEIVANNMAVKDALSALEPYDSALTKRLVVRNIHKADPELAISHIAEKCTSVIRQCRNG